MRAEVSKDFVEIVTRDAEKLYFTSFSIIGIKNFVNISTWVTYEENVPVGIKCSVGEVCHTYNFFKGINKGLKINFDILADSVKGALHLILNEKFWDEDYWNSGKERILYDINKRGCVIDRIRKRERDKNNRVIRVELDELVNYMVELLDENKEQEEDLVSKAIEDCALNKDEEKLDFELYKFGVEYDEAKEQDEKESEGWLSKRIKNLTLGKNKGKKGDKNEQE